MLLITKKLLLWVGWVTDNLQVQEDFLGLYSVPLIDAEMLVSLVKDVLIF